VGWKGWGDVPLARPLAVGARAGVPDAFVGHSENDYRVSVSNHVCTKIWEGNGLPYYSETRVLAFWRLMLLCV
jgi:hypothetical protein